MTETIPDSLGLLAGRGIYPNLLVESARQQGVKKIYAIAFKKETDPVVEEYADEVEWFNVGQLTGPLNTLKRYGVEHAVMAGQITPTHLFRVRLDRQMLALLAGLKEKNAHTIFNALGESLAAIGIELLPAPMFMQAHMPQPGLVTDRAPSAEEQRDMDLGIQVAEATSDLDIGQTVVIKQGTILAIEAFEGTDETIKRAAKLAGPGIVIVKLAKDGHDMRFDIPTIGMHTMTLLRKVKAAVLAVEAGRSVILEKDKVAAEADRSGISLMVIDKRRS